MNFSILKVYNLRHAIMASLEAIKDEHNKVSIIVPDKLTVTMERELFSYLNIDSTFDIEVITLTRFSQKILTELEINYTPISKVGSAILLKKLLVEQRENLKVFNTPSYTYKYSESIFDTLTQFKASQVSASDMYEVNVSSKHLSDKLSDLRLLSEMYEENKAGLVDSTDRLNLLAVNIKNSEIVKNTKYYFVGFDDFTQQGYNLIEQLVRFSLGVKVCVYSKPIKNSYVYLDEVEQKLKTMALSLNFPLKEESFDYSDSELHKFLVKNIFSATPISFEIQDEIRVFNGNSFSEEIEFVVRDIRKNILNGGRFCEHGIACFDLESHKDEIKNALLKYDINYYIDSSTSIINTVYFKFIINFLRLYADNFQTNNLIQFINSPFIDLNDYDRIQLVKIIKKLNISSNFFNLKLDGELNDALNKLKNILNKYRLSQEVGVKDLIKTLNDLKTELLVEEKINTILSEMNDLYSKKILMQVVDEFGSLIEEVSKFYTVVSLDDLIDILTSAGENVKIMPIPQSLDCVQVLDAGEIFTSFDQLYILNANSKTAPKVIQDVGIILDKDIAQLDFKNKLSPTIAHLNKTARFKLFNSAQMFNRGLLITMSESNEAEYSELAKYLINSLKTGGESIKILSNSSFQYRPLSRNDLLEYLSSNRENDELLQFYGIKRYQVQEKLKQSSIEKLHFGEISCSALEKYFVCPFSYFLNYGLRLKAEEKFELEKVDIGNIIHYIAEQYYKLKRSQNNIEIKPFVKNCVDDFMKNDVRLAQFMASSIYFNLLKEATRFVEHLKYLDENSLFEPKFQEYSFGVLNNKTIPLTNEVFLRGKIDRIDFWENYVRIVDYKTGNVGASFEDLYYGKKLQLFLYAYFAKTHFSKSLAGSFYMPIKNSINTLDEVKPYKLIGFLSDDAKLIPAWDKNLKLGKKSDLISLEISSKGELKSNGSATKLLDEKDFDDLLNYSREVAKQAISEIKDGNIMPSPIEISSQQTSCSYCPYLSICRKNSMQIGIRTKKEVNLESFGGQNA